VTATTLPGTSRRLLTGEKLITTMAMVSPWVFKPLNSSMDGWIVVCGDLNGDGRDGKFIFLIYYLLMALS
jgi:hypothetical protein